MAGFITLTEWTDAIENGQTWTASFCKVPAVTTIAGQWFDYSTAARSPVPNYYASSPLVAAVLDREKGLPVGPACSPATKVIQRFMVMNAASGAAVTTSENQPLFIMDYLLYYPFIDMDAAGENQILDNTQTLTRHTDGRGVRAMLVAQAATLGGGTFTMNYTNQAGVSGRVTPTQFCAAAQPFGALVSASGAAGGVSPFITLQDGDTGIRSVQSINFSLANGGLAALVLVKPMQMQYSMEACRVNAGESFGSASMVETLSMRFPVGRIYDDSYIHFIGQTTSGSVSGAQMTGIIDVVWN